MLNNKKRFKSKRNSETPPTKKKKIQSSNGFSNRVPASAPSGTRAILSEFLQHSDDSADDCIDLDVLIHDKNHKTKKLLPETSRQTGFGLFEIDSDYILVLNYSQSVKIFGLCTLKVLHGKVDVLGHELSDKSSECEIFSPRGSALLPLKNASVFTNDLDNLGTIVPRLAKHSTLKYLVIRRDSSILLLKKSSNFELRLIENYIAQWILPVETSLPRLEIEPKGIWNGISIPNKWYDLFKTVAPKEKFFICGGKGVGKSTFLRFSINRLLKKFDKVHVIDLDPGQSEFTTPGAISMVTVSQPLLGPNYTHLLETNRSILCSINVSLDPHKYVKCIENLVVTQDDYPTLINYMGYTSDIAFHLVSSAIAIIQPTHLIYLQSSNRKKDFKIDVNVDTICEHAQLFSPHLTVSSNVKILKLDSMSGSNIGWSLEARQMREMSILAYFGRNMDESMKSLQDHRLQMFEVDLLEVEIVDQNNHKLEKEFESINANIVALCSLVYTDGAIFRCFGWGIVRAVDVGSKKITIISPMDEDKFDHVTHLVVGCLSLPPAIYMNHDSVQQHVPYVMEGELIDFAQMSKRTHISFQSDKN